MLQTTHISYEPTICHIIVPDRYNIIKADHRWQINAVIRGRNRWLVWRSPIFDDWKVSRYTYYYYIQTHVADHTRFIQTDVGSRVRSLWHYPTRTMENPVSRHLADLLFHHRSTKVRRTHPTPTIHFILFYFSDICSLRESTLNVLTLQHLILLYHIIITCTIHCEFTHTIIYKGSTHLYNITYIWYSYK